MKTILWLLAICLTFSSNSVAAENKNSAPIELLKIATPPTIDGLLDESVWKQTNPISDFLQRFPRDGDTPTEKTEVYLAYTRTDLFIGVRCYDSQPDKMVATVMQRDNFDLLQNEQFVLAIDSYNDGRNGYWFSTNALGMRADCQFINEGETWICEWDGIWDCQSQIDSLGWTTEIKIPFSTLRFEKQSENVMGINLFRRIIRTNEEIFSPHIPLQYPHGTADVSIARKFKFKGIAGGNNFYVQPYILSGRQSDNANADSRVTTMSEIGGEIRYDITDNFTSNFTYNTDFAQVELDDRQINLTRFNLFFLEKRDFFLENAGLFSFGLPQETEVFFSRTIGLTQNANNTTVTVPILMGGKLTGRAGKFEMGLMDVQTRSQKEINKTNFSVARIKYQVLPRSYLGFIATNKFSESRFVNNAIGVDANIFLSKDIGFSGFASTTVSPGESFGRLNSSAFNLTLYKRGERKSFNLDFTDIGKYFDPQMGFLQRSDVRKLNGNLRMPLYVDSKKIRRLVPEYKTKYFVNREEEIENSLHEVNLQIELQSNETILIFAKREFEYVPFDFSVFKSVLVPVGNYTTYHGGLSIQTKQGRKVSSKLALEHGGLFDGTQTKMTSSVQWKVNRHLTFFQDYETAFIDFAKESFRTHIAQSRIHFSLSTKFFINSLIQYDNESDELGLNFRLNYQFREGRDLFLVYNVIFDEDDKRFSKILSQSKGRLAILKFNYLFDL